MGNVENPENPEQQTTTTNPEEPSQFGKWVGNLFQSEEPSVTNTATNTATNTTNKSTATITTQTPNHKPPTTTVPVKQEPVSEVYGTLTLNFSRGVKFPKGYNTRLEIGLAHASNSAWIETHACIKKSQWIKGGESPHYAMDWVGVWSKGQVVKIIVYGQPKIGKEYILGSTRIDYHFFRAWYINGKTLQERRIALDNEKNKDYGLYLTIQYEGVTLAPDKEVFGYTTIDVKLGAKAAYHNAGNEIDLFKKDIDGAIAETQKEAKSAIESQQEPERKQNKMEKMGNKVQDKLNFLPF